VEEQGIRAEGGDQNGDDQKDKGEKAGSGFHAPISAGRLPEFRECDEPRNFCD
jgi:hypothetical protein